jgi:KaiC/GvpD/RAD55 family RecA-like ATPase
VLFTLEETPNQLGEIARGFGWDLDQLAADGLLHVEHTSPVEISTDRFLGHARAAVVARGARSSTASPA